MKKNIIFLSLVVVLTMTVSIAYAGSAKSMVIYVPFEFYMGDQLLPAGEYNFEMNSRLMPTASVVFVRTDEGKGVRFLLTRPEANKGSNQSNLSFNQYGERHFLSSVSIGVYKANIAMSKLEEELRIAQKTARTETLVARN